jgi:hypothetical protein
MVKVCVPCYSILGQRRVFGHCPLNKHPHSSLQGWSHPSLRGYSSMSLEYPNSTFGQRPTLENFSFPFSLKVCSFSTKVSSLSPSLRRSTCGIFHFFSTKVYLWDPKKNLLWSKIFQWYNTMLPICWAPSIYWITFILIKLSGHHPSSFLIASNHDILFRTRRHSSLLHQTDSF